jgi:hypothetical protein
MELVFIQAFSVNGISLWRREDISIKQTTPYFCCVILVIQSPFGTSIGQQQAQI